MNETASDPSDEQTRALLRCLLDTLRRASHTPLDARLDGDGMAAAILTRLHWSLDGAGWPDRLSRLDTALGRALTPGAEAGAGEEVPPPGETFDAQATHPLGRWLERAHARLRRVHPSAVEIAALCLDGMDDRGIAERLALGRRLVGRVRCESAARLGEGP